MTTPVPTQEEIESLIAKLEVATVQECDGLLYLEAVAMLGRFAATVPQTEDAVFTTVPVNEQIEFPVHGTFENVTGLWLDLKGEAIREFCRQGREQGAKKVVEVAVELDGERFEFTFAEFKARISK